MITVDDLNNWMDENEEDPIVDGPFNLKKHEFEDFLSHFSDRELREIMDFSMKRNISSLTLCDFGVAGDISFSEKISKIFVDILNKYNYPNEYTSNLHRPSHVYSKPANVVKQSKKVFDVDDILDKISKSGMSSLTQEELDFLKTKYK